MAIALSGSSLDFHQDLLCKNFVAVCAGIPCGEVAVPVLGFVAPALIGPQCMLALKAALVSGQIFSPIAYLVIKCAQWQPIRTLMACCDMRNTHYHK